MKGITKPNEWGRERRHRIESANCYSRSGWRNLKDVLAGV